MENSLDADDLVKLGWDRELAEKVAAAMGELASAAAPLSEQSDAISSSQLDSADWGYTGSSANVISFSVEA
jgi:hypothetical protein